MEEVERAEKILRDVKRRNTHTYWAILIISKKDYPPDREIKLESHAYTLPNIEYKDHEDYKKLVIKDFNQKIREKHKPRPGYRVSPILSGNLYLTRDEAEKRMEKIQKD
jgi:hypothetical protein